MLVIVLFTLLLFFGVVNVALGVVVEAALYTAEKNTAEREKMEQKDMVHVIDSICAVFEMADTDGNGELDEEEFEAGLLDRHIGRKLKVIGIPNDDMRTLFKIVDADGSGSISLEEFRRGCLRMRGQGQNREVVRLALQLSSFNTQLDDLQMAIDEQNNLFRGTFCPQLGEMNLRFSS